MTDLREVQIQSGATFDPGPTPLTFGNDAAAVEAARQQVALYDRSAWGRIEVSDRDRLTFLHNQSTNDFKLLKPGEGRDTVFITSTARTIDLATAYVLEDTVLVLVSPNRCGQLMTWLDRYIFFGDRVTLTDVTPQTAAFNLVGAASSALIANLGLEPLVDRPYGSHQVMEIAGRSVRLAVGSGLAIDGYTVITPIADAAAVWQALVTAGAMPIGDRAWERLRVEQGRPQPDRELTEDYNPLEAGLWQTISFTKGCYIGQETIARLDTYKGVKQQLWGIRLSGAVAPGTPITLKDEKIGILTSVVESVGGTEAVPLGLAYIRTKAGGAGLKVQVGTSQGEIIALPFVQHPAQPSPVAPA
jgi:tRNA-modifying protein YgfZ